MGVSGGAPKNPTSDIILPARFNEHGSEALRWIFGIDRMRDSNDARTCELKENFMTKREKHASEPAWNWVHKDLTWERA